MPVETTKEVVKIATEAGASWWQWALGIAGGFGGTIWAASVGRLGRVERNMVTKEELKDHTNDEDEKFSALFNKADSMANDITAIRIAVARIEEHTSK